MAALLTAFARRLFSPFAIVITLLTLGFASAANAGFFSLLRQHMVRVDLRVDSFVLDRSQAAVGETLTATVTVSNEGTVGASSARLTFWAASGSSMSDASRIATAQLGTLLPKARLTHVSTFAVPNLSQGGYQILAAIETSTLELDSQNNTAARTLQVVTNSPPSDPPPPPTSPPPSLPPSDPPPPSSPPPSAAACNYYASPSGAGSNDGLTPLTPFRPQDFWAVAAPGKTLCLMDGTYTGSAFMLAPQEQTGRHAPAGTSNAPITIRALNDGQVLLDGQGQHRTVRLSFTAWYVLEGFNARNSSGAVISIGSDDMVLRRIVAWDAQDTPDRTDFMVFYVQGNRILLEDVAGFGLGRKVFQSQLSNHVTYRRAWGRFEGYQSELSNPRNTIQSAYNTPFSIVENGMFTWTTELVPGFFGDPDTIVLLHSHTGGLQQVLGTVAYLQCHADDFRPSSLMENTHGADGDVTVRDSIAVIEPGCWTAKRGFDLGNVTPAVSLIADRITTIGGAGTNQIGSDWKVSNVHAATRLAGVPNPYTGANAANVCKRYVNGVLTDEPLWPWPMDQRIKDALAFAGRTPLAGAAQTVTSEIESLLGPIPAECRRS